MKTEKKKGQGETNKPKNLESPEQWHPHALKVRVPENPAKPEAIPVQGNVQPVVGLCVRCGKPGAHFIPAGGVRFCDVHFSIYVEKKIKQGIREVDVFGGRGAVGVALSGSAASSSLLLVLSSIAKQRNCKIVAISVGKSKEAERLCKKLGVKLASVKAKAGETLPSALAKEAKKQKLKALATGHCLEDFVLELLMYCAENKPRELLQASPGKGPWGSGKIRFPAPLFRLYQAELETYAKLKGLGGFGPGKQGRQKQGAGLEQGISAFIERFERDFPGTKHKLEKSLLHLSQL